MSKFRLKELKIENLLSHKNTKIVFDDVDNFILVHGRDLDKMTYAGAGKSCIENAITFSLFGKVYRGQTSGSINNEKLVSNWARENKEPLTISLSMESEGGIIEIEKQMVYNQPTGTKTKLLVNGEVPKQFTTPQAPAKYLVDKILQMDYRTFSKMHSFRTGNQVQFFSLRGMEQLDILEKFVSKVSFTEMSKIISEDMVIIKSKIEAIKRDISMADGEIESLKGHKEEYVSSQRKKFEERIEKATEKIKINEKLKGEVVKELQRIDMGQEKVDFILTTLRQMKKDMDNEANSIKVKKRRIASIRNLLKNDQCPTCFQELDRKNLERIITENKEEMTAAAQRILKTKEEYLTKKEKYDSVKEKLEKIRKKERELIQSKSKHQTKITFYKKEIEHCKYDIGQLETTPPEYYEKRMEDLKKKRTSLKRNLTRKENELSRMKICFDSLKKKSPLKQYILQPLMPIFSNLMNKYFPVLWGADIQGQAVITPSNNVEFNIHKGHSADNYESASSGECRIVDIAALLSFIEFAGILNRTTLGFMVLDEILESLDKVLAIRVLNLLKEFAVTNNIQIIFITNNSIIIESQEKYGLFDRELIFQKQNGVTKLVENREDVIEFDELK